MSHGFVPVPGFIIDGAPGTARAPFREEFLTVEAAAHECSLAPACRGFTLSAAHMQDDRLHFVRFFSHASIALSSDWISHVKEPTGAHRYEFAPGYLLPRSAADANDEGEHQQVPLVPLHAETTTLHDAFRYCSAEPACEGFSLARAPAASDNGSTVLAWVTFAGRLDGVAADARLRSVMSIYDDEHVSYLRGAPLPSSGRPGATDRTGTDQAAALLGTRTRLGGGDRGARQRIAARLFVLQLGYLGGRSSHALRHARMSHDEGRVWCSAHPKCAGFSAPTSPDEDGEGGAWLTFWSGAPHLSFSEGWKSYVRGDAHQVGPYLQQPGFLQVEGAAADVRRDAPRSHSSQQARVGARERGAGRNKALQ